MLSAVYIQKPKTTYSLSGNIFWHVFLPKWPLLKNKSSCAKSVPPKFYFILTFFNINYQHLYLIRWVSNLLSLWACRHFQMLFCSKVKKYEEQVKQKLKSTPKNINHVKYKGNLNSLFLFPSILERMFPFTNTNYYSIPLQSN